MTTLLRFNNRPSPAGRARTQNKITMKTPTENAFFLSKVKIINGGGLDVHFEVEEKCGEEIYRENYHLASSKDIHPDLQKAFDRLKPYLAQVFYLNMFELTVKDEKFKATKAQIEAAKKLTETILASVRVIGVSLSGKDDNVGVVLTGTIISPNNQKMAINTHRMKFSDTLYGFEEDMEQIAGQIEREVYLFLFKNKKAEMELFDSFGEPMGKEKWDENNTEEND